MKSGKMLKTDYTVTVSLMSQDLSIRKKNLKKKQISHFTMKPKSKNSTLETINISHEHSHIVNFGKSIKMHGMEISLKETLENMEISHNMRLSKENGEYIIHIPYFRGQQKKKSKKIVIQLKKL